VIEENSTKQAIHYFLWSLSRRLVDLDNRQDLISFPLCLVFDVDCAPEIVYGIAQVG
jgi:hypothetical protein